jgi:hypothetical protein
LPIRLHMAATTEGGATVTELTTLSEIYLEHNKVNRYVYDCYVCGKEFNEYRHLDQHLIFHNMLET